MAVAAPGKGCVDSSWRVQLRSRRSSLDSRWNGDGYANRKIGRIKASIFFASTGWLFREQHGHDYGIDAHVEIVEDGRPTGKLIAFQIKPGSGYFLEQTSKAIARGWPQLAGSR